MYGVHVGPPAMDGIMSGGKKEKGDTKGESTRLSKLERRPDIHEIIVEKFRRDTAVPSANPISSSLPLAPSRPHGAQDTHAFISVELCTATMNDCARRGIHFSVCRDFSGGGIFIMAR